MFVLSVEVSGVYALRMEVNGVYALRVEMSAVVRRCISQCTERLRSPKRTV